MFGPLNDNAPVFCDGRYRSDPDPSPLDGVSAWETAQPPIHSPNAKSNFATVG